MVLFIYYRRSLWLMLPLALGVSFSRIYNGVHYPSDVLVGAILGAGYAACTVWTLNSLWRQIGPRWFPLWWTKLPSLLDPKIHALDDSSINNSALRAPHSALDHHWLRFGYVVIGAVPFVRLIYIGSRLIE